MAVTKNKLRAPTKRKTPRAKAHIRRGSKLVEPSWDGCETWSGEVYHKFVRQTASWYYSEFKHADLQPFLWDWMKDNGYTLTEIKQAKAAPGHSISTVACYNARMLTLGRLDYYEPHDEYWQSLAGTMGTTKPCNEWVRSAIQVAIDLGKPLVAQKEADDKAAKAKGSYYRPTIQDRLNEKVDEILGELEGRYDEVIMGSKSAKADAYKLFQDEKLPQAKISNVVEFIQKHKEGLEADWKDLKKGDEQCKEAYAHMKPADWKRHIAWYEDVLADCQSFAQLKKTTRKARVKKMPSRDKLVAKLKYKATDDTVKVASINPGTIIEAEVLWVYNTKTRKLGKYVAEQHHRLGVKGASIIGFDESQSVQKTLRKPIEQLATFQKANKINLRKFMSTIKTTETKLTGRINNETILLKVE